MNVYHLCVRWVAVLAILVSARGALGADEEPDLGAVTEALIEATGDPDAEVRYVAFTILAKEERSDAIVEAFRRGLEDDDVNVRQVALSGLVEFEGATDEVLKLLVSRLNDPFVGDAAGQHLVNADEAAVPYLIDAMKHDEMTVKAVGLLGRTKLGAQRATVVSALTAALKDKRQPVRLAATRSLGNIMEAARRARQMERERAEADARFRQYYERLVQKYDKNADGSLTEDEWTQMSKNPQAADANRDGRITVEEYARWSLKR
jgi:hypothetical protein